MPEQRNESSAATAGGAAPRGPSIDGRPLEDRTAAPVCGKAVYWWDGEYEGECELPEGHEGDHFDGLSWFNDDGENTTDVHT